MQLTKFSDYALRTLMVLALEDEEGCSTQAIAARLEVSAHHLGKVVMFLAGAGYVEAKRGRGGGLRLGRPSAQISIGEVVRATERGAPLVPCFDPETNTCNLSPGCRLTHALADAQEAFYRSLDPLTLASMVQARSAARSKIVELGKTRAR